FTAFKKKWLQRVMSLQLQPLGLPRTQNGIPGVVAASENEIDTLFVGDSLLNLADIWPAGELEAYLRLDNFIAHDLTRYLEQRDFLAIEGTSTLSSYLAVGSLSPRQSLAAVLAYTYGDWSGNAGASCWISELIWRE